MKKFLLMSILIGTFWVPLAMARKTSARRGVRLVQKRFLVFCVCYVITVLYIMPRL